MRYRPPLLPIHSASVVSPEAAEPVRSVSRPCCNAKGKSTAKVEKWLSNCATAKHCVRATQEGRRNGALLDRALAEPAITRRFAVGLFSCQENALAQALSAPRSRP